MDPQILAILKVFLSILLGGIIGYERERAGHFAGIRTHIVVCLTSTFLMSAFTDFGYPQDSIVKIAAGLLTGIGFIGAGTILSHGTEVRGLTTAASVWCVAGLGIIIGLGAYLEALIVTVLTVFVLEMRFFSLVRKRI